MLSLTSIIVALSVALSHAAPLDPRQTGTQTYNGDITYYEPGLGSCGETSTDSDAVVALSPSEFSQIPQACGKSIKITGPDNKTVDAKVVDKCPACASGSIDVSSTVFQQLAPLSDGRIKISWTFSS
ncbi:RlpA-like double-psi beta-barrel-protein domain-containing protein-containing protein [Hypoxylon trugodes]|uniref:RlpA-like double-psi beta-barrel-protein domain-containing protein-containing protein n=1 Tax=Hypoxylon trugodes TaxID=326681 RepID=UPI0021A016C1|nr:RlpA-like double-psi beta-barrel-protein domain-containing protein-containing protein [Hypoxylon trugodes]KAI1391869.1 RlpA-like double-psi beta-barrel-protein domain-containing protein-containing protein [Hypoxylon trugodes]